MVFSQSIQCIEETQPTFNIALPSLSFKAAEWRPPTPGPT